MSAPADYIVVIKSSGIGDAEPDLGETLMKSFLKVLAESETTPAKVFCFATGVFLTTEGSPVIDLLRSIAARGTEIYSCTTCMEYYGRKDKLLIGHPTTMKESFVAQLGAGRVIYA